VWGRVWDGGPHAAPRLDSGAAHAPKPLDPPLVPLGPRVTAVMEPNSTALPTYHISGKQLTAKHQRSVLPGPFPHSNRSASGRRGQVSDHFSAALLGRSGRAPKQELRLITASGVSAMAPRAARSGCRWGRTAGHSIRGIKNAAATEPETGPVHAAASAGRLSVLPAAQSLAAVLGAAHRPRRSVRSGFV
jgi:hypothetical protein